MSSVSSSSSGESLSQEQHVIPDIDAKIRETADLLNALVNLKPGFMLEIDEKASTDTKTVVHPVKMKMFFGKGIRLENGDLMKENLDKILVKVKENIEIINSNPITLEQSGPLFAAAGEVSRALTGMKSVEGKVSSSQLKIALRPKGAEKRKVGKYLKEDDSRLEMLNQFDRQVLSNIKRVLPPMPPKNT